MMIPETRALFKKKREKSQEKTQKKEKSRDVKTPRLPTRIDRKRQSNKKRRNQIPRF